MENYEKLVQIIKKVSVYNQAVSLVGWDMETKMPKNAINARAEVISELSAEAFEIFTSPETGNILKKIEEKNEYELLNEKEKRIFEMTKREYYREKKVPADIVRNLSKLTSKGQLEWQEAKEKKDFGIFEETLEKLVEITIKMADIYGYEENRYDALLDLYEKGLTVKKLDKIIDTFKEELVGIIEKIKKSEKRNYDFMHKNYDIKLQEDLSYDILKDIYFDLDSGRLDVSIHPFTTKIGPDDVRITTRFREEDFTDSLYSTIHEAGHALYEQGISKEYEFTPLDTGASMAIHESQSRFWENIIGRSQSFVKYLLPKMQQYFSEFDNVNSDEFYKAINIVKPSLIRVDADEVTYNIHIMIRYEIERDLINGKIKVKDLPSVWNSKVKEYLGIIPENDSEGVLQDVHWAHASFGYFPSYMLGNLYSAQIYYTMKKDITDFDYLVEKGEFKPIVNWLRENIHNYGSMYDPSDLIVKITGENLNSQYFMRYIKEKYSEIYKI
ncbi:MAG TPA: carboxypeptidase M32 [Tepiditoga sp.]|nr:carboxypeptidase M32 [Tepiditoga sp.]